MLRWTVFVENTQSYSGAIDGYINCIEFQITLRQEIAHFSKNEVALIVGHQLNYTG
jgi:hypothetical protein